MPFAMVPAGYEAVFLGQAGQLNDLGAFVPLEQDAAEGALFLVRLDLAQFPSEEALIQLEQAFQESGVEHWPGYDFIVYADSGRPSVYLAWQKGFAWLPIIIGLLVTVVLPPLLGSLVWQLMPQSLKDLITNIVNLGMMALVMFLLMQVMKPLTAPKREKVEKAKPAPELKESVA